MHGAVYNTERGSACPQEHRGHRHTVGDHQGDAAEDTETENANQGPEKTLSPLGPGIGLDKFTRETVVVAETVLGNNKGLFLGEAAAGQVVDLTA